MFATNIYAFRSFGRNARLFLVTLGLATLIIDGVYAVVFNLYLLRLGYDAAFVGQINSAGLLTFAVASLPAGELGKRWGSRRAMIAGLFVVLAGSLALPFAGVFLPEWQSGWLMTAYVVMFLGYAIFFVNGVPFLMGATTPEQRNHAFAAQTAIFSIAAFFGGIMGGTLPALFARLSGTTTADPTPYRVPLVVAALLLIPGIVAAARTTQDLPPRRPRSRINLLKRLGTFDRRYLELLAVISVVRILQVGGMASANTFFNVYMDQSLHVPTAQIGAIAALARIVSVPAALSVAVLATRWGQRNLVIMSGVATVISLLPLALLPFWGAAAAGFIGVTAAASIRYPAFLVYSMEMVTEEQRPTMSGLSEMTAGVAFSSMALIGGYVITNVGYAAHFLLGAVAVTLGTIVFAVYFRKPRGVMVRQPVPMAAD